MNLLNKENRAEIEIQIYYRRKDMERKNRGPTNEPPPTTIINEPIIKKTKSSNRSLLGALLDCILHIFLTIINQF